MGIDNSQKYFEMAAEMADVGYWRLNLEKEEIYWSEQVYKIHGVDPKKFTPTLENAVDFYHPADRDHVRKSIENSIAEKKGDNFDLRIICTSGKIHNVQSKYQCELDDNGNVIALFGVFQDITERLQNNVEVEESRNFLRTIIDNVPDMIFAKDEDLNVILGNKAFWNMYDKPEEELLGTTTFEKFPKEEAEAFAKRDREVFEKGHNETEEEVTDSNNVTRIYNTKKIAFRRKNDSQVLLGISRDTTQRRKYEEQVKEYSAALEMRNLGLERSNQALEEFAHTAAHDLKEPIRSIHNYVEMILYDYKDLNSDIKEKLEKILSVSWRMGQMVSELLLFSEVTQVSGEITTRINLNNILQNELEALQARLEQENTKVTFDNLPEVICHPTRVGEIFRNLIVNGVKYNKSKEKNVEIGCDQSFDVPVFFVKDNGIGIKDSHKDEVFRLFKRLHGKNDYGGGTGIGLAIVKKIVEMHNGKIWFESEIGKGTTFYFTLQEGKI